MPRRSAGRHRPRAWGRRRTRRRRGRRRQQLPPTVRSGHSPSCSTLPRPLEPGHRPTSRRRAVPLDRSLGFHHRGELISTSRSRSSPRTDAARGGSSSPTGDLSTRYDPYQIRQRNSALSLPRRPVDVAHCSTSGQSQTRALPYRAIGLGNASCRRRHSWTTCGRATPTRRAISTASTRSSISTFRPTA